MPLQLKPEQVQWLEQQVAAGRFESIEDAVQLAVADMMSSEASDLTWAKPLLEKARHSLARGEGIPADAVRAELEGYFRSKRSQ
jgi:Arc/MetJ-type ribon-helix-helix transcriptional regulator